MKDSILALVCILGIALWIPFAAFGQSSFTLSDNDVSKITQEMREWDRRTQEAIRVGTHTPAQLSKIAHRNIDLLLGQPHQRHVFENVFILGVGSGTQVDMQILEATKGHYDLIIKTGHLLGYAKDIVDAIAIDAQIKDRGSYLSSPIGNLFGEIVEKFGPCTFNNVVAHSRGAYALDLELTYGNGRIKVENPVANGPEAWGGELKRIDNVKSHPSDPIPKITKLHPQIEISPKEQRVMFSYHETWDHPTELPGIIGHGIVAPLEMVSGLISIPAGSLKHHATDNYGLTGNNLQQTYERVTIAEGSGMRQYDFSISQQPEILDYMQSQEYQSLLDRITKIPEDYKGPTATVELFGKQRTISIAPSHHHQTHMPLNFSN